MRLVIALAAASAAMVFSTPFAAHAQLGPAIQVNPAGTLQRAPSPRPRFIVEAVRFRAHNETGWDRAGSDEVYAVFEDRHSGQRRFTGNFGDVDSGETRSIPAQQRCIAPLPAAGYDSAYMPPATWDCQSPGEAGGLNFRITLFEKDGWSPIACAVTPNQQAYKKNCDDDEIATFQHQFTAASLVTLMPTVGNRHVVTTPVQGGYSFIFRIRRLPDASDPPPVLQ